ncbi:unnamed protein product [Trichogramma brassicae]|uniref:Uncharacterized protein n=1 Tax=Trichogramma brassicae TaxID=86971 RepID=A0A6H5I4K0_9HYME|nr:unnamed protein product [Trichogramma brassicae]
MAQQVEITADILRNLRAATNWEFEEERRQLLEEIYPQIEHVRGPLPCLLSLFERHEIDWLLLESVKRFDDHPRETRMLIAFVSHTGYSEYDTKDQEDASSPSWPRTSRTVYVRRSTALHEAAKQNCRLLVTLLFKIYDRFDVNYVDEETGLTHFHVACLFNCHHEVGLFLFLGQDPNCRVSDTGDRPLHLAVQNGCGYVVYLLMRVANANATNHLGQTPLHVMSQGCSDGEVAKLLLCPGDDSKYQPANVNAWDNRGRTPLHCAIDGYCREKSLIKFLLRNGADQNLPDQQGSTPLHLICRRQHCYDDDMNDLVEVFFEVNAERQQEVYVDARDAEGRTPLQYAVANLLPHTVDVLLANGADLSDFVFPSESSFEAKLKEFERDQQRENEMKLLLASAALLIVESLEKKGYELQRSDALTLARLFAKYEFFRKSSSELPRIEDTLLANEEFAAKAREMTIRNDNTGLTLHDVIQMPAEELAAELLSFKDCYDFARSFELWVLPDGLCDPCDVYLCDKMLRGFFRRWELSPDSLLGAWIPYIHEKIINLRSVERKKNQPTIKVFTSQWSKVCQFEYRRKKEYIVSCFISSYREGLPDDCNIIIILESETATTTSNNNNNSTTALTKFGMRQLVVLEPAGSLLVIRRQQQQQRSTTLLNPEASLVDAGSNTISSNIVGKQNISSLELGGNGFAAAAATADHNQNRIVVVATATAATNVAAAAAPRSSSSALIQVRILTTSTYRAREYCSEN